MQYLIGFFIALFIALTGVGAGTVTVPVLILFLGVPAPVAVGIGLMHVITTLAVVTLWAAGVQASPLGKLLGAPLDRRGCVEVDDRLNPPGLPEIFVLGDLAHLEQDGHQIPGVAQPAMQMGDHVAKIIAADLAGKPRPAFRYFDKGDMATIGRMDAVAKVEWPFKAHMSGFPAWAAWLVVHIFFLIGFRNRVSVFAAWVWTYFTFTRGARLITGDQRLPGWQDQLDAGPAEKQTEPASSL